MKTSRRTKSEKKQERFIKRLKSQINTRIWSLLLLVLGVLCVLGGGILWEALSTNKEYSRTAMAQLNYSSTVKVAMPGDILDANHSPIAVSYRVYVLILDPKVIYATEKLRPGSLEKTVELTAEVFGLDPEGIRTAISKNPDSSYLRYNGKTIVTEEQKEQFEEEQEKINHPSQSENGEEVQTSKVRVQGVWFDEEPRRYYPYGTLASKLVGFATEDASLGLWGLELQYNDVLRGINGREYSYLNSDSNLERNIVEPQNGATLVTTLDMNLEKILADELREWLNDTDENGQRINSAKSVSILAMDPHTGAVLAYVTDSDYDPNTPTDLSYKYSDAEIELFARNTKAYKDAKEAAGARAEETGESVDFEWDYDAYPTTQIALNAMWRNSLVSDSYEPGSTGKVMTFAAALEEGVIDKDTSFECLGNIQVGNYNMKCHNYVFGGCGVINAYSAIARSCNVAFIDIGLRLGSERLAHYQELFNFGQKTGIDLPGEASCKGLLYSADQMHQVELATNAFGQCYNVTRIQLAAAFCAAINGGNYYKPYLVSQILDDDGTVLKSYEPVLERQVISEETSRKVREALRETVIGEGGTGGGVQVSDNKPLEGYSFIAKTGTAEKLPRSAKKYLISVISAIPEEDPQIVLYITIDEYGGELQNDSAPAQFLSGDIWGSTLDYLGIYSENEPGPEDTVYEEDEEDNEVWQNGDSMMENMDGDPSDTPIPPEDDGSGSYNGMIVNPESVVNPNDVLPAPPGA